MSAILQTERGGAAQAQELELTGPLDELADEHRVIRAAIEALEGLGVTWEATWAAVGAPSVSMRDDLVELVDFFSAYADGCHHFKEENLLFPALKKVGLHDNDGPLPILRAEHDEMRRLLESMREAIDAPIPDSRWVPIAEAYCSLLDRHLRKEDGVLFPWARARLPADTQRRLAEAFAEHEMGAAGVRHHALEAAIRRLYAHYVG